MSPHAHVAVIGLSEIAGGLLSYNAISLQSLLSSDSEGLQNRRVGSRGMSPAVAPALPETPSAEPVPAEPGPFWSQPGVEAFDVHPEALRWDADLPAAPIGVSTARAISGRHALVALTRLSPTDREPFLLPRIKLIGTKRRLSLDQAIKVPHLFLRVALIGPTAPFDNPSISEGKVVMKGRW